MLARTVRTVPDASPACTVGYCSVGGGWQLESVRELGFLGFMELFSFPEWIGQL